MILFLDFPFSRTCADEGNRGLQFASESQVFRYTNTTRSADASAEDQFGVDTRGQMMLVPANKFGEIVEGMEGFIGVAA